MSAIKQFVGKAARKLAPETMRTLEHASGLRQLDGTLPELVHHMDDVLARLERVERRLAELEGMPEAVDELRRDSLRIAELTDLVVTTLGALPGVAGAPEPRDAP